MKISKIRVFQHDLGFSKPYTIAFKTISKVVCAFVEIELEDGTIGRGSGIPSEYVVKESFNSCMQALHPNHLHFLLNQDIRSLPALLEMVRTRFPKNPAARACIDLALHDALCRYWQIPLHRYLGNTGNQLSSSITIGIKSTEESLTDMATFDHSQFPIVKLKVGYEHAYELERIRTLKAEFPHFGFRIDANQAFDRESFSHFFTQCAPLAIELFEQPTPADDLEVFSQFTAEVRAQIAADESCKNSHDLLNMLRFGITCGIINIKLMKTGGLAEALRLATIARESGIALMWGCNNESALSISAALHAAYAFENTRYLDLDGYLNMEQDICKPGFEIKNGLLCLNELPGLGYELLPSYKNIHYTHIISM
jgi:L-Ala-D/L-Glu epimerase